MDKLLTMSNQEITRLEVMQRLKDKRLLQKEAAQLLGISLRQVKRLWRAYRKEGAKGLVSVRRGKPSNHRLDAVNAAALDLIQRSGMKILADPGARELVEVHGLQISRKVCDGS